MSAELQVDAVVPTDTTLDLTVYEDVTGDGVADNQETVSIQDGTNTYTLDTLKGEGSNDYWLEPQFTTNDAGVTPYITQNSASLTVDNTIDRTATTTVSPIEVKSNRISNFRSLVWETQTDWENATKSDGIEVVGNTFQFFEVPDGVTHRYDADSPETAGTYNDGDTVNSWQDLEGSVDSTESQYSKVPPSYAENVAGPNGNRNAVNWTGSEALEANWSQDFTQPNTFILAYYWNGLQQNYLWDGRQDQGRNIMYDGNTDAHTPWANNQASPELTQISGDRIIAVVFDRSNSKLYDGLASEDISDPGAYDSGSWHMGSRSDNDTANSMNGYWYEAMFAPERLTDTEIKDTIQALADKWNISIPGEGPIPSSRKQ